MLPDTSAMGRIMVIDYSGHPFQVQLSRGLAGVGHEVLHLFTGSSETPKGDLVKGPNDPDGFDVRMVRLDEPFNKTDFVKRRSQERQIGRLFAEVIAEYQPQVIIASNCPIETLKFVFKARKAINARLVFWVQDLLGEAASRVLSQKLGLPGRAVGLYFQHLEKRMLHSADHVVAIAEEFVPVLRDEYGLPESKITVIENWSPIDDIPLYPRDNAWAKANLPEDDFRIIYSGTLGFKQDPALMLDLAREIDCRVLVFSEGAAARKLEEQAQAEGLENFEVRAWLDFADLPKALAAADLLVVVLEPDAGMFSVPSKVLTYLCAGRPILGSINTDNLAARIINRSGAGFAGSPDDRGAIVEMAKQFRADKARGEAAGKAGRAYAEEHFDIAAITANFSKIISKYY